jgi:uncharacterized protein
MTQGAQHRGGQEAERLITLDVVRGFAVLVILWVNILSFAMPDLAFLSPHFRVPPSAWDEPLWLTSFLFADGKFRGLFTLLFGASMMLVMDGAAAKGADAAAVHGRRMLWLAVIGLGHHLLIWHGDILLTYALMGLLLTALHRWRAKRLICCGTTALLLCALWISWLEGVNVPMFWQLFGPSHQSAALAQIEALHSAELSAMQHAISADIELFRSNYSAILQGRWDRFDDYLLSLPVAAMESLPLMMIGAGLYRSGFLSGAWVSSRYHGLISWTLPLGLCLTALPAAAMIASDYDPMLGIAAHLGLSVPGRLLLIVSYAALLILWLQDHRPSQLTNRLSAAGRMALSNYLASSLIMTSLFYGYGLGLYAVLDVISLYAITAITCGMMLIWSPWWMARYHYGPAEWLWRSLARWHWQPFRRG